MSVIDWLAAWANVPFTFVLGATVLFAGVQASGLMGLLAGGDGHDGHDVDADAGDVDGHDLDADGDVDADGHEVDGQSSLAASLFAPLGIGRIPITLSAEIAGAAFAAAGLAMNSVWLAHGSVPLLSLAWTLPASAIVAYGSAALLARVLGPIIDDRPHAATSRQQLVGAIGTVISSRVNEEFGELRVRDKSGHDVRVVCKLARGVRVLDEREEAVIVEVDERGALFVAPLDEHR